jgi:hypothetical protein
LVREGINAATVVELKIHREDHELIAIRDDPRRHGMMFSFSSFVWTAEFS